MLKAIETRYAGRRFRSRREARWAILFDELDLDWRYEPEGYVLPGNIHYLVDFELRLGDGRVQYVEVKPELEHNSKLASLVEESRAHWVCCGGTGVAVDGAGVLPRQRLAQAGAHRLAHHGLGPGRNVSPSREQCSIERSMGTRRTTPPEAKTWWATPPHVSIQRGIDARALNRWLRCFRFGLLSWQLTDLVVADRDYLLNMTSQ